MAVKLAGHDRATAALTQKIMIPIQTTEREKAFFNFFLIVYFFVEHARVERF